MQLKAPSVRIELQETCNYECHSNNTAYSISNDSERDEVSRSADCCLFCKGGDGQLIRLENGALTHITCRESQQCCFCKDTGMTILCPTSQCIRVFHPWCADNLVTHECDQHSASAKKKEKLQVMYTASQQLPDYPELASQLKAVFRNF